LNINILNQSQARWTQMLAEYDFKIFDQPSSANGNPDTSSWYSKYHPEPVEGCAKETQIQPINCVLIPNQLVSSEGEMVQVTAMKL
jgi:hypothetical protein